MNEKSYYNDGQAQFYHGDVRDCLRALPAESVHCVVTSPPYWGLRDYGVDGQLGLEATPEAYVAAMVDVFREVKRVLRNDGTLWLNIGDSYAAARGGTHQPAETLAGGQNGKTVSGESVNRGRVDGYSPSRNAGAIGLKHKDLVGIPWMLAFALRADGWYLRQDIIWAKPNPMPESVRDRCTKAHEYLFLLSKSTKYYFNTKAIAEPCVTGDANVRDRETTKLNNVPGRTHMGGLTTNNYSTRNKRSVWTIATEAFSARLLHGDGPDGNGRKVSPDCPVHGDPDHRETTEQRGEPPDAFPSARNPRSDGRLDLLPLFAPGTTDPTLAADSGADSSGSRHREHSGSATAHSTRTRKTGRAPETTPPCTPSAQSPDRTVYNGGSPEMVDSVAHMPESSSEPDDSGDHPLVGTGFRNAGKPSCTCIITDHFATFPTALVRPCVLAGCPEGGTVLDPFLGSGTTALVAKELGRRAIGIDLNAEYLDMAKARCAQMGFAGAMA